MTAQAVATYTATRGATFTLILRVTEGTVTGSEPVRMVLKEAVNGRFPPGDAAPEIAVFTVGFEAAAGNEPDRWVGVLAANDMDMAAGTYITDARIDLSGTIQQAAPVLVEVEERVTEPA